MSGWHVPLKRKPVCKPRPGTKCDNPCRLNTLQDTNNNLFFTSSGFYGTTGPIDRVNLFNNGGHGYDSAARMMVTVATGNY